MLQIPYLFERRSNAIIQLASIFWQNNSGYNIAKEVLKCDAVHVLSAPAIFAKYGTKSDAALETILHELTLRGAVKPLQSCSSEESTRANYVARIYVVLDHFETYIDHGSNIDSYTPVLNSIGEFIS